MDTELANSNGMTRRVASFDWAQTSLGPRPNWPASLKTAAALVTDSQFPMALLWGDELTLIYNDGYRDIIGAKHPQALGRPTREVWPEPQVRRINDPLLRDVMTRGLARPLKSRSFRFPTPPSVKRMAAWAASWSCSRRPRRGTRQS
jgi:hypothetical protein